MMYNEFIKEMTNMKKFRNTLKKAERQVVAEEDQMKSRMKVNSQMAKIHEERRMLEMQLEALNNL